LSGYLYITLYGSDNRHKTFRLARLVGKYFCEKPPGCDIINHLDGVKTNNHASNLEWTTTSGNGKHAFAMGLSRNAKGAEDSQSMPVAFYSKDDKLIASFGGIKEAGRETGIPPSTIARLAKTPDRVSRKYRIKVKYI